MLLRENYTAEHILRLREETGADPSILERTVFAFGLLEAIRSVDMPFIFKGGTSLLVMLDEPRRLSTDIDIIVDRDTDVDGYIEKAGKIFPGMSIRFVSEEGVSVQVDPKGTGQYVSFRSLSGGEKAAVAFLLMLMFASISGIGILILDELSIMDEGVLDALLAILKENGDEYDMAVLACVSHADTLELLKKHGLEVMKI